MLVAICSVLDLYNCSRLVSGVQHIAILQEMVYILFSLSLFLTQRFPHQQTRPNVIALFLQMDRGKQIKSFCSVYVQGIVFSQEVQSLLAFLI